MYNNLKKSFFAVLCTYGTSELENFVFEFQ